MLPEFQYQNLDQTLCSKSEQKFSFMTKPQPPNVQETIANTILIITFSNSNNMSWHLHKQESPQSSLLNRAELVSQFSSVSDG